MYFKGSVPVFWGSGVAAMSPRAEGTARLRFFSLFQTLPAFLLPLFPYSLVSALLVDLGLGNLEAESFHGNRNSALWIKDPGNGEKPRAEGRADPGLPMGGARGPKKCLGDNVTQALSTSTLRVGSQMPKKELNLLC